MNMPGFYVGDHHHQVEKSTLHRDSTLNTPKRVPSATTPANYMRPGNKFTPKKISEKPPPVATVELGLTVASAKTADAV
jgi:hypothetical protein